MEDQLNMDDISAYFEWKNNVEKNELPGTENENETVTELSRKLSISTIVSGDGARTRMASAGEPKQKMPINRQVELILKWKEGRREGGRKGGRGRGEEEDGTWGH